MTQLLVSQMSFGVRISKTECQNEVSVIKLNWTSQQRQRQLSILSSKHTKPLQSKNNTAWTSAPKVRDDQNASEWQMKVDNKRAQSYDIEGAAVIPSSILTHFVFNRSASKRLGIQLDNSCHFKHKIVLSHGEQSRYMDVALLGTFSKYRSFCERNLRRRWNWRTTVWAKLLRSSVTQDKLLASRPSPTYDKDAGIYQTG